jgi:hypothetical protein
MQGSIMKREPKYELGELRALQSDVRAFARRCAREEYTDTGYAWDLLNRFIEARIPPDNALKESRS